MEEGEEMSRQKPITMTRVQKFALTSLTMQISGAKRDQVEQKAYKVGTQEFAELFIPGDPNFGLKFLWLPAKGIWVPYPKNVNPQTDKECEDA
jgi:hypothetical protein